MTLKYLDAKRLQGVEGDLTSPVLTSGTGGWVEVGRTTLGSTTEPITVSSLPDKKYYMILTHVLPNSGRAATTRRLGYNSVDTGNNYSSNRSDNGSNPGNTNVNRPHSDNVNLGTDSTPQFCVEYCSNISSKEKLAQVLMVLQNSAGAGTAPQRAESVWKWVNTSNPLNIYEIKREPSESADWLAGSECVVLGWDDSDTHGTNFWQELASVDLSGGAADVLDSGTFTAKKYLWVQAFMEIDGNTNTISGVINFNNDTSSSYARRRSSNGVSDSTETSHASIDVRGGETKNRFENLFIINNASNEKLVIGNGAYAGDVGAGTAPDRTEFVAKWSNTANQITSVKWTNGDGGSYGTSSIIKVWGHD